MFPPISECLAIQATFYDNGPPVKNVRKSKTEGGKAKNIPRHMVTLMAWTDKPIDLFDPDFQTSLIMIQHHKLLARLTTWETNGSMSPDFLAGLRNLHAVAEADPMLGDRMYYAPFYQMGAGQHYIDDQLITMVVEGGSVSSAVIYRGAERIAIPTWSSTYPGGSVLAGKAKAMARLDLCGFNPAWATC